MDKDQILEMAYRLRNALDASERVKLAADLGDYGDPEVANIVLEAIWEDEKSNVREIAVHSYAEIMKLDALPELMRMVKDHPDENVRFYAVYRAGELGEEGSDIVIKALDDRDRRVRAMAYKKAVDLNLVQLEEKFIRELRGDHPPSVIRNILLGLALWRTKTDLADFTRSENKEFRTLAHLSLARRGSPESRQILEEGDIDTSIPIKYNGEMFRGREGLIKLAQNSD